MKNKLFTFAKLSTILLDKTNYKHELNHVEYYETILNEIEPIQRSESEISKFLRGGRNVSIFGNVEDKEEISK